MPPPSSENDLKRRARRRLIGAVALMLLAVIVLPLLLEDEPQPGSPLAVRMAVLPAANEATAETDAGNTPVAAPQPLPAPTAPVASPPVAEAPKPPVPPVAAKPPAPKPQPRAPTRTESSAPQPKQSASAPAAAAKPAPAGERYAVQLAALGDAAKARSLAARARAAGLPAYTDQLGTLTRVRVGPFSTREAAQEAVRKLTAAGIEGGQVLAP